MAKSLYSKKPAKTLKKHQATEPSTSDTKTVKLTKSAMKRVQLYAHYETVMDTLGKGFTTNFVPGDGNINAKVVFVGEAPGAQEDAEGKPFVGASGKLLNKMLKKIGMRRRDVFITNFLHWRPPNNRDPKGDEVPVSNYLLRRELEILNPVIVVTLGRFSTGLFFEQPHMATLAGSVHERRGFRVFPMYHPAVALYDRGMRATLMEHFMELRDVIESAGALPPVKQVEEKPAKQKTLYR